MEYKDQYQDKRVYLRDVQMWLEDCLTALDIWTANAKPQGEEAELNCEIIEDFKTDLKKDFSPMIHNTIDEILGNTVKCRQCGEPLEWCAVNTPYCQGNEQKDRLNALFDKQDEEWGQLKKTIDNFCMEGKDADLDN